VLVHLKGTVINDFKSGKGDHFYIVIVPTDIPHKMDVVNVRANGQRFDYGENIDVEVNANLRFVNL